MSSPPKNGKYLFLSLLPTSLKVVITIRCYNSLCQALLVTRVCGVVCVHVGIYSSAKDIIDYENGIGNCSHEQHIIRVRTLCVMVCVLG